MAKKNRVAVTAAPAPRLTKRQISRLERERRLRLIFYLVIGATAVVVIGLISYGILNEQVLQPRETVVSVNGVGISRETYWKMRRFDIGIELQQLQFQAQFGGQNAQFIRQRAENLQNDLRQYRTAPLDVPTLEKLANNELLRQRAGTQGVTIGEADLQAEVEREYAPPPATPTPVTTAEATQTAVAATLEATLTVQPTLPPTRAPITGTPPPTATPTTGPTLTPTPFYTPTLTVTPTAMSQEARATAATTFREQSSSLRQAFGMTAEDYRELVVRPRLLEQAIKAKLNDQVPAVQPQVRALHILVATEEAAKEAKAELAKGTSFAEVARQRSTDPGSKEKGGDLDWFPRGIMAPEFEQAAFALAVGAESEPVKTQFGFHIIKVVEKADSRPVMSNLLDQLRDNQYDKWLKEQRESSTVTAEVPLPSFAPTPTPATTGTVSR